MSLITRFIYSYIYYIIAYYNLIVCEETVLDKDDEVEGERDLLPPSALLLVIFVSTSLRTDTNTDKYNIILYTILQQQVKHLSRKSSRNTAAAS